MLRPGLFLISVPFACGKTAFLEMVIANVRKSLSVACYGFKEVAVLEGGKRIGYDLVSELNGHFECHPFVRTQRLEYDGKAFKFDETVAQMTLDRFRSASYSKLPSLLYFDELGYHEAISGRLWPAARVAISSLQAHNVPFNILFTARQCNIDLIRRRMTYDFNWEHFDRYLVVPKTDPEEAELFVNAILRKLRVK
jgi:nucleoside-triphosphatase THEP1